MRRNDSGSNWVLDANHGTNDGTNVTRTSLSNLGEFAIVDEFNCTPPAAPAFTGESNPCLGDVDTYTITSPMGGFTYDWTVTGGTPTTGTGTSVNVTWGTTGGNYEVTVRAVDPACTFSDLTTLAVTLEPFSTSAITGNAYVEENTTGEAYSITDLGGGHVYTWTITGGTQASGGTTNSITVDWGTLGIGEVRVKASIPGCTGVFSPEATLTVTKFRVFVSAADGDFDVGATWVGGIAPGVLDNVRIEHAVDLVADTDLTHVIIAATGTLDQSNNKFTICRDL